MYYVFGYNEIVKFKITIFIITNIALPIIVGGIMVKFSEVENCVPGWLPFELPCWVWIYIQWLFATATFLDIVIYWFIPNAKKALFRKKDTTFSPQIPTQPQVRLSAQKFIYPTYNTQTVGVILHNHETDDLTDIYIKLVSLNHQGFNDSLAEWEIIPVKFHEDNRLFDSGENLVIRANDNQTFKLAGIQDKNVFFLLKERPFRTKQYYPNIHEKYSYAHETWELKFDVYGKILGKPFEKQRFLAIIDSTMIESFADSEMENSLTIDIKGDISRDEKVNM